MARVTVEDCLKKVPNRFALTVLASRRARALSENRGVPLVECDNKVAVTALREVGAGGVRYTENVEEVIQTFIDEQRAELLRGSETDHTFIDAANFGSDDDEDVDEDDIKELTGDLESLDDDDSDSDDDDDEPAGDSEIPPETTGDLDDVTEVDDDLDDDDSSDSDSDSDSDA